MPISHDCCIHHACCRRKRIIMAIMESAFLQGFALNAGLIVAIGAQNAFVLAQGLTRQFVWTIALTCSICDAILIAIGVGGAAIGQNIANILTLGGALYLLWFGVGAAKAMWRGDTLNAGGNAPTTVVAAFRTSIALSLLNPHAILDMTVIFGGVSAHLPPPQKIPFALGGALMSFVWFFVLAFAAVRLSPLLQQPAAWRIINGAIAALMFIIALSLLHKLTTA